MINNLPIWIETLFLVATFFTLKFYCDSNNKPKKSLIIIVLFGVINSILAYNGFYENVSAMPPRFSLVLLPSILFIAYGLTKKSLSKIEQNRNIRLSTLLHTVRIPVEIVLVYLFYNGMIPQIMTFEGWNFDILIGITAPLVTFFFLKNRKVLIFWNFIGLIFIINILVLGLLSGELPFQQFAFDQPNKAVQFYPFILLPAIIVPIVIYTHITDLYILLKKK